MQVNPGNDFHRRQLDIRSKAQARLNSPEWRRRGKIAMSELVNPDVAFHYRAALREGIGAEIIRKVMHPSQAPASQDGIR